VHIVKGQPTFRRSTSPPSSEARNRKQNTASSQFFCFAYSSTLQMGAISSPETSVDFQRIAGLYRRRNTSLKVLFT
jgi:hypothetical protein